jgi:hypothetical protein
MARRSALQTLLQDLRRHSDYWRSLPNRALGKLLLAVFFMFSTTGLVGHIQAIAATGRDHWIQALVPAVLAGMTASAFVFAFIRDKRFLLPIIAFQIGWVWLLGQGVGHSLLRPLGSEQVQSRIGVYGSLCILTLLLGYLFFIDFIVREGVKHMGLRAEMALAERTHRSLVPPIDRRTDRLEAYGESRASSQVGGDLLDATEHDGKTLLYVADVSGHGVAAGTLMSLTKGAMRARLLAGVPLDQLLTDLNRVLLDLSSPNMFVTLAAIRLAGPGEAEVCLAGHLPILHFEGGVGPAKRLLNQSVPLGILPDAGFETTTFACRSGDVFAILTDGLTEVEDVEGDELGVEGVEELLSGHLDRPLPELHATVMEGVGRHGPQHDDQTLLLVRVRQATGFAPSSRTG